MTIENIGPGTVNFTGNITKINKAEAKPATEPINPLTGDLEIKDSNTVFKPESGSSGAYEALVIEGLPDDLEMKTDSSEKIGGLSGTTKDDRLKILAGLTQLDSLDETKSDASRCGCSSLVGGVLYAGGAEGLKDLIGAIEQGRRDLLFKFSAPPANLPDLTSLLDVKAKLNTGEELTKGDISIIEETLYNTLNNTEYYDKSFNAYLSPRSRELVAGDGISPETVSRFLERSPEIDSLLKENGVEMISVDRFHNDGVIDHGVVHISHDGKSVIYDPWPVKDMSEHGKNNQVIKENDIVREYLISAGKTERYPYDPMKTTPLQ